MTPVISVVIPTHNPRADYLARVVEALRSQTLPRERWQLLVVDNGSREPLKAGAGLRDQEPSAARQREAEPRANEKPQATEFDLSWHPSARIVREEKLGLTFARLRGFAEAKGELIVMVDDDNLLAPDYLETAVCIAQKRPGLGAFGGKCLPEFEVEPEGWLASVTSGLGLRDRGEREEFFPEAAVAEDGKVGKFERGKVKQRVTEFPDCAPIGAGMVLRREAARAYAERLDQKTKSRKDQETITDRKGESLASGGDNDICLTAVEEGWQVGYLPQLQLTHLIPKQRMTLDYQKRMAREAMRSFVLMLDQHGIRPWSAVPAWSVPLRVANDYVRVQPWKGPERLLKWCMNRGRYEACGSLAASGRAAD